MVIIPQDKAPCVSADWNASEASKTPSFCSKFTFCVIIYYSWEQLGQQWVEIEGNSLNPLHPNDKNRIY
jgi:hypothetical protein